MMRKLIRFMALMKELSLILMFVFQSQKYFVKYSQTIKVVLPLQSLTNSCQEQNISLLSIIISEDFQKRILFIYAILIHKNKQRRFSLSNLTKHYSYIQE